MQAVLRLPVRLGGRIQISPLVLSVSLAPMILIVAFVTVMFWVSFQKGIFAVRHRRSTPWRITGSC